MPNFPVHSYGMENVSRLMGPAIIENIRAKQEGQTEFTNQAIQDAIKAGVYSGKALQEGGISNLLELTSEANRQKREAETNKFEAQTTQAAFETGIKAHDLITNQLKEVKSLLKDKENLGTGVPQMLLQQIDNDYQKFFGINPGFSKLTDVVKIKDKKKNLDLTLLNQVLQTTLANPTPENIANITIATEKVDDEHGMKLRPGILGLIKEFTKVSKPQIKDGQVITFGRGGGAQAAPITGFKPNKPYTPQQLVDDTRGYYQVKMKTMLDEDGFIKPGMESQYETLTNQLESDMATINQGKKPSWLTGKKQLTPELAKEYLNKAGGDKEKARKAAKQEGYSF